MVPLLAVEYSDGEILRRQALVHGSAGVLEEGCMVVQLCLAAAEEVVAVYKGLGYLVGLIDLLEEPSQFVGERFQHL